MEVISIIVMFMFGNMSDQNHQMTQYIPMESISKCMKEVRMLKKKKTEFDKFILNIISFDHNLNFKMKKFKI